MESRCFLKTIRGWVCILILLQSSCDDQGGIPAAKTVVAQALHLGHEGPEPSPFSTPPENPTSNFELIWSQLSNYPSIATELSFSTESKLDKEVSGDVFLVTQGMGLRRDLLLYSELFSPQEKRYFTINTSDFLIQVAQGVASLWVEIRWSNDGVNDIVDISEVIYYRNLNNFQTTEVFRQQDIHGSTLNGHLFGLQVLDPHVANSPDILGSLPPEIAGDGSLQNYMQGQSLGRTRNSLSSRWLDWNAWDASLASRGVLSSGILRVQMNTTDNATVLGSKGGE